MFYTLCVETRKSETTFYNMFFYNMFFISNTIRNYKNNCNNSCLSIKNLDFLI